MIRLSVMVLVVFVVGCAPAAAPPPLASAPTPAPTLRPAKPALSTSVAAGPAVVASPSPIAQAPITGPNGEKLVEQSAEVRFQLDLQVPAANLAPYMPSGWSSSVATSGPAKDANLRAVFIDRLTVNGPNGMPLGTSGTNQLVYLVAPVKDQTGAAVQLVIGGITQDPGDAPGPFGNYLPAKTHTMRRTTSDSDTDQIMDSEDWNFVSNTGEHLELHVKYVRGSASRGPSSDTRFYSAKNPSFYQLSRQEQVLDILRNVTTNPPDRVKEFSFIGNGGAYSKIFDGTERVLSWDNIPWINRSVFQP
jgi:hypothetical protein